MTKLNLKLTFLFSIGIALLAFDNAPLFTYGVLTISYISALLTSEEDSPGSKVLLVSLMIGAISLIGVAVVISNFL